MDDFFQLVTWKTMNCTELGSVEESQKNQPLKFLGDEEMTNDEMENFIDDREQLREDVSFYRKLDPDNLDDYHKFLNQTRDPRVAIYEDNEMYFGEEDKQLELYDPENRQRVEFDKFPGFEKSVKKFLGTLKNFDNSDNLFFDSTIYGFMHHKSDGKILDKSKAKDVLGNDFYVSHSKIKNHIQLDRTLFGYFNRCFLADQILAKHDFFLKLFEKEDKFRFLIKKKVERKNKVTQNISGSSSIFVSNSVITAKLFCKE